MSFSCTSKTPEKHTSSFFVIVQLQAIGITVCIVLCFIEVFIIHIGYNSDISRQEVVLHRKLKCNVWYIYKTEKNENFLF